MIYFLFLTHFAVLEHKNKGIDVARRSASFPFTFMPLDLEDPVGNDNSMFNKAVQNVNIPTLQRNGRESEREIQSLCTLI